MRIRAYDGIDVHDMEDLGEQYIGYTEAEPKILKLLGLNLCA
jgi:Xaa-Pro aminopeptidase